MMPSRIFTVTAPFPQPTTQLIFPTPLGVFPQFSRRVMLFRVEKIYPFTRSIAPKRLIRRPPLQPIRLRFRRQTVPLLHPPVRRRLRLPILQPFHRLILPRLPRPPRPPIVRLKRPPLHLPIARQPRPLPVWVSAVMWALETRAIPAPAARNRFPAIRPSSLFISRGRGS